MPLNQQEVYDFGPFRLEPAERRLSRNGETIKIPPKAFDLLCALVEAKGRMCRYEELRQKVWPGEIMEDQTLTVHISHLRKALGGAEGDYIENVRGVDGGYRFVGTIGDRPGKVRRGRTILWSMTAGLLALAALAAFLVRRAGLRPKPSEGQGFYRLALSYERQGDDDQALAALDKAVSLDPRLADAYLEAACIHHELDEEDSAREYLEKAKAQGTTRDEAFKLKVEGLDFEIDGYQDQALQDYQLAVDRFPRDITADYRLADLALNMGRLDDAERPLRVCLQQEPDNPFCSLDNMVLSLLRNDFDAVLRQYQDLSDRRVRYPWFHAVTGAALLGKDDLAGAAREFQALQDVKTKFHGTAHFRAAKERLADLHLYEGKLASARLDLQQSMENAQSKDERADDLIFLARIEMLFRDPSAARTAANEAIRVSSAPIVYISAARVLAALGDRDVLHHVLSKRTSTGADLGDVGPENLNFMKGVFALHQRKFEEAATMLRSSYEEDEDPFTAFLLAEAYEDAHRWNRAAELYDRVLAARGNILWNDVPALLPLSLYHRARCDGEMGRTREARNGYSQFLAFWSEADGGIDYVRSAKHALATLSMQ